MYNKRLNKILNNPTKKNLNIFLSNIFDLNDLNTDEIIKNIPDYYYTFIFQNIKEGVIKNIEDLKFYILNELNLMINNNKELFYITFNNQYKEFNLITYEIEEI